MKSIACCLIVSIPLSWIYCRSLLESLNFDLNLDLLRDAKLTMMLCEKGPENNIRCRAINEWFKMDSYVSSKKKLMLEIEKVKPDAVVMDLGLYVKIDGIETSRRIRLRFDVPVVYF